MNVKEEPDEDDDVRGDGGQTSFDLAASKPEVKSTSDHSFDCLAT